MTMFSRAPGVLPSAINWNAAPSFPVGEARDVSELSQPLKINSLCAVKLNPLEY